MSNKYLNRSNTTSTQFMEGYPTKAGDVTHLRAITYDTLGTIKKDYSHSTGSAWLGANASDRYEAVSDLGTSFVFSTLAVTLDHNQTAWVVRGTNLELWYFGNLIESKDITGETFTLNRYGSSTDSATGGTEWKHIYPSALTAENIQWFSYLRNQDTNEILLPPIFPDPIPPLTSVYSANSVVLNGTSQYLELQGDVTRLNIGTNPVSVVARCEFDSTKGNYQTFYVKCTGTADYRVTMSVTPANKIEILMSNATGVQTFESTIAVGSNGWHSVLVDLHRTSRYNQINLYIDGALYTGGFTVTSDTSDMTGMNLSYTDPFRIGNIRVNSGNNYSRGSSFVGVALNESLTLADAVYLHNGGLNAKCWADMVTDNSTLTDKFTAYLDNATYNGSSEIVALTDHVNGWVLSNINSAPFTGTGLEVECN